jgi:hypothetical protein
VINLKRRLDNQCRVSGPMLDYQGLCQPGGLFRPPWATTFSDPYLLFSLITLAVKTHSKESLRHCIFARFFGERKQIRDTMFLRNKDRRCPFYKEVSQS